MCKINAGYFVVNEIAALERNYHAIPSDKVNLECWAILYGPEGII